MKKFVVIKGGASAAESGLVVVDWRRKFSELRAIEAALTMRRHGGIGPRVAFSALLGLLALGFALAGVSALGKAGINIASWISMGLPPAMFVLAYKLGRRYSTRPWTYTAKMDGQLAKYEPIDREAYRHLQEQTKKAGSLETIFLLDWLEQEREAVALAGGLRKPETTGFLSKKV